MATLARSIEALADPLYGHSPGAGELVVGYVDLLSTLALLSDPTKGRALDGGTRTRTRSSDRLPDTRSVWAGRRLDYVLDDLAAEVDGLTTFVEEPRPIPKRNRTRIVRCPDCGLRPSPSWNACPRCLYDLRRNAGRGPHCALASCSKVGRPRRHGARYCDECSTALLGGPG